MIKIEYGAMSSRFEITAENKFTAYVGMVAHFDSSSHLIAIYTPEFKEDQWLSITGQISDRLDEIFGGEGSFDKYVSDNIDAINTAIKTIKRLV